MIKNPNNRDEYLLDTGRKFHANSGIIGIGSEVDDRIFGGYDDAAEISGGVPFTAAERQEIALEVIRRWTAWAMTTPEGT